MFERLKTQCEIDVPFCFANVKVIIVQFGFKKSKVGYFKGSPQWPLMFLMTFGKISPFS